MKRTKQVRQGIIATLHENGVVTILKNKYIGYGLNQAIELYRKENPLI